MNGHLRTQAPRLEDAFVLQETIADQSMEPNW